MQYFFTKLKDSCSEAYQTESNRNNIMNIMLRFGIVKHFENNGLRRNQILKRIVKIHTGYEAKGNLNINSKVVFTLNIVNLTGTE